MLTIQRGKAAILRLDLDIALVHGDGVGNSQKHTDHDAKEGQATDTSVPSALLLVDNRECAEEHVKGSVDDSHVDGKEKDDRLLEEQNPGTRQGSLERIGEGDLATLVVNLADVDMASDLGQLGGTSAEEDGRVCLGDKQGSNDQESAGEGSEEAHDPAPTAAHTKETSNDGTKDRSEEGSGSEDSHGEATLGSGEHVGDESQDKESLGVLSAGTSSVEGSEGSICADEEVLATEHLTEGSPEKRANCETQHKQRHTKRSDLLADLELHDDLSDTTSVGR
ncbi:hypothetical protein HG530_012254 [Fusarium avenaceum]|nr:hypothetical protein HG530_012254 [Fusarium avenaceum]